MATSYNICESTDGGTTVSYFDSVTPDSSGNLATTYTAGKRHGVNSGHLTFRDADVKCPELTP